MPSVVTLGQLKAQVLDLADMTNSAFPVDARVTDYINAELSELYDLLVTSYQDYFVAQQSITLVANTESYALPSSYYKTLKVFVFDTNDQRYEVKQFMLSEMDSWSPSFSGAPLWFWLRYRVMGGYIWFTPRTSISTGTIQHWYIPEFTKLTNDATVITFSVPVGWEDYVVFGAAARLLIREESDASMVLARKEQHKQRIINAAPEKDAGSTARIVDSSGRYNPRRWVFGGTR